VKRITALIVLALGVSLASPVLAEDDQTSGNYWLHECKKDPKQLAQSSGSFQYGWCFGVVYDRAPPTEATLLRRPKFTQKPSEHIGMHRVGRHEDFFNMIALNALKRA